MTKQTDRWTRGAGLLIGLAIAFIAISAWRLPPGDGTLGADLVLVTGSSGELSVDPAGPFHSAIHMMPSDGSDAPVGELEIFNKTARTLRIRAVAVPSEADLDDLAWLEIASRGHELFRGPLGALADGSDGTVTLASGETASLTFRTWIPEDVGAAAEGRIATVTIAFDTRRVEP
jgi:hypothetical protein